MKTMKKVLLMLVLAAMLLSGVACGNAGSDNASEAATTAEAAQPSQSTAQEEKPAEEITLVYTTWVNNKDADGNYIEENAAKEFSKLYPNIKVDVEILSENDNVASTEKQDIMIAAGETIDVALYGQRTAVLDRAKRDMLLPLDEYFQEEKFSDLYAVDGTIDGKIYMIPTEVKSAFVMINKQMLDEAGLSVPETNWTWDDFREYAKALTKGEGAQKRYGSYFHTWTDYMVFGLKNAYPHWIFLTDDGQSNIKDPNIKDWLQFVSDMENVDKSTLPYFEAKANKAAYRDLFFQGKIAMLPIGTWMIPEIASTIEKYPHDWVTTFASVPQWKDFPAGASQTNPEYLTIPKTSKHLDAAVMYAKFLSNEGAYIRASGDPATKTFDTAKVLEYKMGGKPELYDTDALSAVLESMVKVQQTNVFEYTKKVDDAVGAELEKFLTGGAKLDEVIENADKIVNNIIAESKK